jgi:integrase
VEFENGDSLRLTPSFTGCPLTAARPPGALWYGGEGHRPQERFHGRRREVGMDPWGWDHLRPWLELRMAMPVGPLLCVIGGPTRGRPWASDSARAQLRRVAAKAGVRRRFAPHQLRHAHAVELAREGVPLT